VGVGGDSTSAATLVVAGVGPVDGYAISEIVLENAPASSSSASPVEIQSDGARAKKELVIPNNQGT